MRATRLTHKPRIVYKPKNFLVLKPSGFAPLLKPIQRIFFFEPTASSEPTFRRPTLFLIIRVKSGENTKWYVYMHIHTAKSQYSANVQFTEIWRNIEGGGKLQYCVIKNACSQTFLGAKVRWRYIGDCKHTNKRIKNISLCVNGANGDRKTVKSTSYQTHTHASLLSLPRAPQLYRRMQAFYAIKPCDRGHNKRQTA